MFLKNMEHCGVSRDTVLIWRDNKYASHKNEQASEFKNSEIDA